MPPGSRAHTFTPNGDSSWARDSVKPPTAHFAAWYGVLPAESGGRRPMISGGCSRSLLAHERYGRAGDVNHAIEVGIHHRLEPLRAQLLVACCGDESIAGFEYSLRN